MAFKVQKIEQKNSKRNLKRIFEEYRVIVQNCFFKDRTPSNFVGRIRSNLNFEVILKVKKAKKCKIVENCKIVFGIFWQIYWPQRAEILHSSLSHKYLHFSVSCIDPKIQNLRQQVQQQPFHALDFATDNKTRGLSV